MNALKYLLIGLFLFTFCGQVQAAPVQATVVSLKGKVLLESKGASSEVKPGQLLGAGDRVTTGPGSILRMVLADGSSLDLGPETDFTFKKLSSRGETRTSVFSLFRGLLRATVAKLNPASKFEVFTTTSVAAVKGTQYEVEAGPEGTSVRVLEGKVWLEDLKRERRIEISRMQEGRSSKEGLEEPREMRREQMERMQKDLSKAPEENRKMVWEAGAHAFREALGETWDDLSSLKEEVRQEKWRDRLHREDDFKLAAEESHVDFTLGHVLTDVHGMRVRMQEFLLRPAPETLQFLNYTRRDNRTDALQVIQTYNQALPEKLETVSDLGKVVWASKPTFWLLDAKVLFLNGVNDSLLVHSVYFDPVRLNLSNTVWNCPIHSTSITANGTVLESYLRYPAASINTDRTVVSGQESTQVNASLGNFALPGDIATSDLALDPNVTAQSALLFNVSNSVNRAQDPGSGDLAWIFRRDYGNGNFLEMKSWAIDEDGKVRNVFDLMKTKTLPEIFIELAFKTYNEVQVTSDLFTSREGVDVVSQMLWWANLTKNRDDL